MKERRLKKLLKGSGSRRIQIELVSGGIHIIKGPYQFVGGSLVYVDGSTVFSIVPGSIASVALIS